MTVDELVRSWRDLDFVETPDSLKRSHLPRSPLESIAVLDRELGPGRVDPRAETTCTAGDGCPPDTCPEPIGMCPNTCESGSRCCC
jgi:hypothetical protein